MRIRLPIIVLAVQIGLPTMDLAASVEVPKDSGPVPTRHVKGDVKNHLASLRTRLAINANERDPFGLFQDPGKEPQLPMPTRSTGKRKAEVPFATFINALPIGVAMPGDRMFMVGSRSFRVGQVIDLRAEDGRQMKARVESVQYDKVVFRNMTSAERELAVKSLNLLPAGVEKNNGSITVKGMINDRGDQELPLDVDLPLPAPEPEE